MSALLDRYSESSAPMAPAHSAFASGTAVGVVALGVAVETTLAHAALVEQVSPITFNTTLSTLLFQHCNVNIIVGMFNIMVHMFHWNVNMIVAQHFSNGPQYLSNGCWSIFPKMMDTIGRCGPRWPRRSPSRWRSRLPPASATSGFKPYTPNPNSEPCTDRDYI